MALSADLYTKLLVFASKQIVLIAYFVIFDKMTCDHYPSVSDQVWNIQDRKLDICYDHAEPDSQRCCWDLTSSCQDATLHQHSLLGNHDDIIDQHVLSWPIGNISNTCNLLQN